jgi:hypothetical protein
MSIACKFRYASRQNEQSHCSIRSGVSPLPRDQNGRKRGNFSADPEGGTGKDKRRRIAPAREATTLQISSRKPYNSHSPTERRRYSKDSALKASPRDHAVGTYQKRCWQPLQVAERSITRVELRYVALALRAHAIAARAASLIATPLIRFRASTSSAPFPTIIRHRLTSAQVRAAPLRHDCPCRSVLRDDGGSENPE